MSFPTLDERAALCEAKVTLDGHKAKISGYRNDFATVRDLVTGNSPEWAWETVQRIVARGGAFRDVTVGG